MKRSHLRVFIGLAEISGCYNNLVMGFNKIGVETLFYTIGSHSFEYDYSEKSKLLKLGFFFGTKRFRTSRSNLLRKLFWASLEFIIRLIIFVYSIFNCKVFIFVYGQTFLPNCYDLWILRLFNKTIISNIGHGSEARHPLFDGSYIDYFENEKKIKKIIKLTKKMKEKVIRIEKLSDYVIGMPNSSHYFTKSKFINWFQVGLPGEKIQIQKDFSKKENSKVKILHCPSQKNVKGTVYINEIINNLTKVGMNFEYIEISGKAHKEVLPIIENCDLLIDQLFSDVPMSVTGSEAARLKKASIVGTYAKENILNQVPKEMLPPSILCNPNEFELVLNKLIKNKKEIITLGKKAYKFVSEKWSNEKVAERYLKIINNNIPESWWVDPLKINYIYGIGLRKEQIVQNINIVNNNFGKSKFYLSDRPDLEKKIFKLIEEN